MNVIINEKRVITGISVHLSTGSEVQAFSNLLEMARRQIDPMYTERRQTNGPYVRDLTVGDFDIMRRMMHDLFDSLPEDLETDE